MTHLTEKPTYEELLKRVLELEKTEHERKLASEALYRSKMMLARTEHIASIGSWEWEIATDTVTWSDELFRIFQLAPNKKVPGWVEHSALYHPEDMESLRHAVETATANGTPYELKLRALRKGGEIRVCLARGFAETGPDGRAIRLFGSLQDITDRKQAEDALEESEKRIQKKLSNLLSSESDIGEFELSDIINTDAIQTMMDDFYKFTRIPVSIIDLEGKVLVGTGWQDICTKFHRVHPDTLKNCLECDTILTKNVPPGTFKSYLCKNNLWDNVTPLVVGERHMGNLFTGQFFYEGEKPDDEIFRLQAARYGFDEQEYMAAVRRVPTWNRETIHTALVFYTKFANMISSLSHANIVLAKSLEDRKRAGKALKESERHYRELVESTPGIVYSFSSKRGGVYYSSYVTDILGYSPEQLYAQPMLWHNSIHPDDLFYVDQSILESTTGKPFCIEYRIQDVRGKWRWFEDRSTGHHTDGTDVIMDGLVLDITERKKAEEEKAKLEGQLRRAQKMESIGSLAGGIAHDLNNILFPISGLSEMLLDDIPPDTPEHKSIEQIHKSAKRGSDLVKQILSFSRQSNPQKLPIRIQPILKEALKLAQATIPRNIEITSHIGTDCGMISADPSQIHQIAMNLITNAFHAVEQTGGVIDIALKEAAIRYFDEKNELSFNAMPGDIFAGRYACITVSDTGTGIDKTLIDKIFEPYFTTKELGKGTGLGLSVVHGIIKEHGGDIRVYSEVGKGTVFHVYLPLLEDAGDSKTAAITRKYPTGRESILLVDDEETIVLLEQMMLERLGYHVTARTSGPDALAAFKANPGNFDLVISDRSMPLMTGEQLAMEMISIKPGIPVIICTGFSDENDVKRAKAMGVKGFLMKPMATGDLAEMVRNVLDKVADGALANEKKEAF